MAETSGSATFSVSSRPRRRVRKASTLMSPRLGLNRGSRKARSLPLGADQGGGPKRPNTNRREKLHTLGKGLESGVLEDKGLTQLVIGSHDLIAKSQFLDQLKDLGFEGHKVLGSTLNQKTLSLLAPDNAAQTIGPFQDRHLDLEILPETFLEEIISCG